MNKASIFITFLVSIIIFLSIVQVVVSNSLSTTGLTLSKMEKEIKYLENQNYHLKEELLTLSSFVNIESKARKIGFVENKNNFFLTKQLPLAVRQ